MSETSCSTCGAPIDDPFATGVLCASCHEENASLGPNLRPALSRLLSMGVIAAVVGIVFHLRVNGIDYVGLPCGVLAIVGGIAGIGSGASTRRIAGKPGYGVVGLLTLLAGVYVVWSSLRG